MDALIAVVWQTIARFFRGLLRWFIKDQGSIESLGRRSTLEKSASRYVVVVDFECTCESQKNQDAWLFEIIEFPAVLIDLQEESQHEFALDRDRHQVFHEYVRPTERRKLTPFCTSLTGIKQETVDAADTLDKVLPRFQDWLDTHCPDGDYVFAADAPSDFRFFLLAECYRKGLQPPRNARSWIDLSLHLKAYYNMPKCNLASKLERLGIVFTGRAHSGIDDAHNIVQLALTLFRDGCPLTLNDAFAKRDRARLPPLTYRRSRRGRSSHRSASSPSIAENLQETVNDQHQEQHKEEKKMPSQNNTNQRDFSSRKRTKTRPQTPNNIKKGGRGTARRRAAPINVSW